MNSFDQTIERLAIYLDQVEGTLILFGVTDDIEVRDRAVREICWQQKRSESMRDFS